MAEPTKPAAPDNEPSPKPKYKLPPNFIDVTAQHQGRTVTIVGAPRPALKLPPNVRIVTSPQGGTVTIVGAPRPPKAEAKTDG
jgi:hypothetical protein